MARKYSIADAKARLPKIIDQAEAGEEIELTRRGRPVAALISVRELARLRGERRSFASAYAAFLEKHSLQEIGLEPGFASTLRDRSRGRAVEL